MRVVCLSLICYTLYAQLNAGGADATRQAMAAAAERQRLSVISAITGAVGQQRESVRKQIALAAPNETVQPHADAFFTLVWPERASAIATASCTPLPGREIESLIDINARREGLRSDLLREVMRRESGFRSCAISRAGALGLMQLMPSTVERFRVRDPFDPAQNVSAGAKFLRQLLDRYGGNIALALGAYNAGPGRVDESGGVPDIPETRDYVGAILKSILVE